MHPVGRRAPRVGPVPEDVRVAALALGATAAAAFVCLALLYAGVPAAGRVNDLLGGTIGWLALWVAVQVRRHDASGLRGDVAVVAAAVGAVVISMGSWLVLSGTTGWFLAGLVSSVGLSGLGAWLLLAHGASGSGAVLRRGPARLGVCAGWLMLLGVLALPGALQGVDDVADAPWHVYAGEAPAWLGALLMNVWALRLARR